MTSAASVPSYYCSLTIKIKQRTDSLLLHNIILNMKQSEIILHPSRAGTNGRGKVSRSKGEVNMGE